jgi:acetylornithine deacetylase/succinyl-diaminopimelate desuccinylase-like protein
MGRRRPIQTDAAFGSLEAGGKDIPLPAKGEKFDPEWWLYARSASDDKAPIIAICAALDALRAKQINLNANLKFFFEGEEEASSPHLEQITAKYKDLLQADAWLICDGPVDQTRQQQIYFGARGVTGLEITVYGPRRELHSGPLRQLGAQSGDVAGQAAWLR